MNDRSDNRGRAKSALKRNFLDIAHKKSHVDHRGYVKWPQENLLSGVRLEQFEHDLREGDGNELRVKFCAIHSSAALAVNCFAPFKDRKEDLLLLDEHGALEIQFEKQMPIIRGRRPSNLDVWIDRGSTKIAIESKLLEYFEPKKPEFAEAYKAMERISEPCWWAVCEGAWDGKARQLDVAQLVKHYFGLLRFRNAATQPTSLVLLYLFWEPQNWEDIAECKQHRIEVEDLAREVTGSAIKFQWMSYTDLWQLWTAMPRLFEHARTLKERYETSI
jgi:hypothetical protein